MTNAETCNSGLVEPYGGIVTSCLTEENASTLHHLCSSENIEMPESTNIMMCKKESNKKPLLNILAIWWKTQNTILQQYGTMPASGFQTR